MNILFIYNHEYPEYWKDGLWAALELLGREFTIHTMNLPVWRVSHQTPPTEDIDFVLGWGAFGSPVDTELRRPEYADIPKGLCIAGNVVAPFGLDTYKVLFYETNWYRTQLTAHPNTWHAFGTNTKIYKPEISNHPLDLLSVGAFALWKRHYKILEHPGSTKMVIGEIQKGNPHESAHIIGELISDGVMISDMVKPEDLARFYNSTHLVYIPASVDGGGERAVLEARACGIKVEVEPDNPKLQELVAGPIWDEMYYKNRLKEGILSCF